MHQYLVRCLHHGWLALVILSSSCSEPRDVVVKVEAPLRAAHGEQFVITATVQNTATNEQTLHSLDVANTYLAGVAILRTDPDHLEASKIPIDDTTSYVFQLPVPANATREVKLHAEAVARGDHNADIDFCINSPVSFLTRSLRTIVE